MLFFSSAKISKNLTRLPTNFDSLARLRLETFRILQYAVVFFAAKYLVIHGISDNSGITRTMFYLVEGRNTFYLQQKGGICTMIYGI